MWTDGIFYNYEEIWLNLCWYEYVVLSTIWVMDLGWPRLTPADPGWPWLTLAVFPSAGDVLLLPIMECAGKDISSWFDPKTRDVSFILSSPFTLIPSVKPAEVAGLASIMDVFQQWPLTLLGAELFLFFPDPEVCGPCDVLRAVLHPQGALCAHAAQRAALRLGHGPGPALVEGTPLRGGAAVGQDALDPRGQHADVTGAAAGGERGPVHYG